MSSMKRKPGKWEGVTACFICHAPIAYRVEFGNGGVCPQCGATATVYPKNMVDTCMLARRKVYTGLFSYEWEYKEGAR